MTSNKDEIRRCKCEAEEQRYRKYQEIEVFVCVACELPVSIDDGKSWPMTWEGKTFEVFHE